MSAKPKFYVPNKGTAPRLAAEYLFKNGPTLEADLCAAVDLGCARSKRAEKLQRAVSYGVLMQRPDGKLDCSDATRAHFKGLGSDQEEVKPIGQITPAQYRPSVFASPGLSKKNIPNSRGLRPASDAAPTWSERPAGFVIKHIAGGQS